MFNQNQTVNGVQKQYIAKEPFLRQSQSNKAPVVKKKQTRVGFLED
jgi:hypothetical protein